MKAVLFDLDNTLYPEIDFVRSGFRAVARYLGSRYDLDEEDLLSQMLDILARDGRGQIFDSLLQALGLYTEDRVRLLVYLYRSHHPDIRLYADTVPTLELLRQHGLRPGIVTDGLAPVQRNKIKALGLDGFMDITLCTDELGLDCGKPSPVPYRVALELLQVAASEAAYVGDDPAKDFIGPNRMGMLTIQVKRQLAADYAGNAPTGGAEAEHMVSSLSEILPIIEEKRHARR